MVGNYRAPWTHLTLAVDGHCGLTEGASRLTLGSSSSSSV